MNWTKSVAGSGHRVALLMTIAADLLWFRASGHAGGGMFLLVAMLLLWLGTAQVSRPKRAGLMTTIALSLIAMRLVWLGSTFTMTIGVVLLFFLALGLFGFRPFVLDTVCFAVHTLLSGAASPVRVPATDARAHGENAAGSWLNWGLPMIAGAAFGYVFLMANPDFVPKVFHHIWIGIDYSLQFLKYFSFWEIPFCLLVLFVTLGLLRPSWLPARHIHQLNLNGMSDHNDLFPAFRNTLFTVVVLFAAYLAFEISTMWFREFPKGFYYAGYAHEGAAWLTLALAMATALLSLIFRGNIFVEKRLQSLKRLAWIWCTLNFVLAGAVYNRLFIYIKFNGMTRMRVIGLMGIATVIVGFILVIVRIRQRLNIAWLIRHQLLTLFAAICLYLIIPVDIIVQRYNVACILNGQLAPAVQFTEHQVNSEGCMQLIKLIDCKDATIQKGVRALLFLRQQQLQDRAAKTAGWTGRQLSNEALQRQLQKIQTNKFFDNRQDANLAWNELRTYAFVWY